MTATITTSPKIEAPTPAELLPVKNRTQKVKSSFLLALIAYLGLNLFSSFTTPIPFDAYNYPSKDWAWWTIKDLRKTAGIHNIALLGSSLMVSATVGCDANYLHNNLDLTVYHKASYLDHLLHAKFSGSFNTFSLSAPGMMPSDAYLMLHAMVNCHNRPDIVIYGIAPRDFIDSTLSSPAHTEIFHYLKRLVTIDDVVNAVFRNPFQRLEWFLEKFIYLYGNALDFQMCTQDITESWIDKILPRPWVRRPFTWWDRVKLLPTYLPDEIHPQGVIAGPIDWKTASTRCRDNTQEYLARYRSPDLYNYRTQVNFLKKMMQYCKKERIDFVLVNMPITFYNANMLRPGIYLKYLQAMHEIAFSENAVFFNLCDFKRYPNQLFHDSVHMNAFGGKQFFEDLVKHLGTDYRSSCTMILAGKELQEHEHLALVAKRMIRNSNHE